MPTLTPTPSLRAGTARSRSTTDRSTTDVAASGVESPMPRVVTAYVTGGLDGALRLLAMLRGRRYTVRDLTVEVADGAAGSRVRCTVELTADGAGLLVERL